MIFFDFAVPIEFEEYYNLFNIIFLKYKITIWICAGVLFKVILYSKSCWSMLVLKLAGIQNLIKLYLYNQTYPGPL